MLVVFIQTFFLQILFQSVKHIIIGRTYRVVYTNGLVFMPMDILVDRYNDDVFGENVDTHCPIAHLVIALQKFRQEECVHGVDLS